jgi:hypothetical protein
LQQTNKQKLGIFYLLIFVTFLLFTIIIIIINIIIFDIEVFKLIEYQKKFLFFFFFVKIETIYFIRFFSFSLFYLFINRNKLLLLQYLLIVHIKISYEEKYLFNSLMSSYLTLWFMTTIDWKKREKKNY